MANQALVKMLRILQAISLASLGPIPQDDKIKGKLYAFCQIKRSMKKLAQAIAETKFKDRPKNIAYEFQEYGVYLAESLGDTKHYSLYIKLAKELDRKLLEEALNFTKGYYGAKNKAKVFMWRLKQLQQYKKP